MKYLGGIVPLAIPELPACLIVAIALRCAVLWTHAGELTHDRDAYLGIARGVSQGKGYVDVDRQTPTAFRPPLYPIQLGGLMLVLPAAVSVAIVNLFWGVVSVWATWHAGGWLRLKAGRNLAALLVAVDPLLLLYSAQPMTEVTSAGLVALLVYWVVRRDCSEFRRQICIGLAFGGLVLCRPTFWPLAVLVSLTWVLTEVVRYRRMPRSERLTPAQTIWNIVPWRVVAGTLLIVGPWIVRNQTVMGSPIVMTTHGGYTLLLANNPVFYADVVDRGWGSEWSKSSFDRWQQELQENLTNQLGPAASEMDRDRWQGRQARQFVVAEPGQFLKAAWFRTRSLWSTVPQGDAAAAQDSRLIQLVGWYYTAVLLAAGTGMVLAGLSACRGTWLCRKQFPQSASVEACEPDHLVSSNRLSTWWPLFAIVLTVQLVHLVYWTNARMRAPIVPVISLFAVAALGMSPKKSASTTSSATQVF